MGCCGVKEGNGKKGMMIVGGPCRNGSIRNSNKHLGTGFQEIRKGVNFIGEIDDEWNRKKIHRK